MWICNNENVTAPDIMIYVNKMEISCVKSIAVELSNIIFAFFEKDENPKENFCINFSSFPDELITEEDYISYLSMLFNGKSFEVTENNFYLMEIIAETFQISRLQKFLSEADLFENKLNKLILCEQLFLSLDSVEISTNNHEYLSLIYNINQIIKFIGLRNFTHIIVNVCFAKPHLCDVIMNEVIKKDLQNYELICHLKTFFLLEIKRIFLFYGNTSKLETVCYLSYSLFEDFNLIAPQLRGIVSFYQRRISSAPFFYRLCEHHFIDHIQYKKNCYQNDEMAQIIIADDVERLKFIVSNTIDFNINLKIKKNIHSLSHKINKGCSLIEFSAYLGSIKCFKFLLLNHASLTEKLPVFAVAGGSPEIIHICEHNGLSLENKKVFAAAIKFHQQEIFEWLIETKFENIQEPLDDFLYQMCISYSNYTAFGYLRNKKRIPMKNVLAVAAEYGNVIVANLLFNDNQDIFMDEIDSSNHNQNELTPTLLACENGNLDFVNFLLFFEKFINIKKKTKTLLRVLSSIIMELSSMFFYKVSYLLLI